MSAAMDTLALGAGQHDGAPRGIALVVDDDATNRMILAGIMRRLGFEVAQAGDGEEAVAFVRQQIPAIVLMDVMMPRMDGFEATRRIRTLITDEYVPILFLTALDGTDDLSRCIEVGGDDFFLKPYEPRLLEAKLVAIQRNIDLHRRIREQRDELARYQARLKTDMEIAASIFSTIWKRQALSAGNVRFHLQPVETMNGDLILGCITPSGGRCYLVGDFTGHGLPAAMCAMRVADIFYSMAGKGFSLSEIVTELNEKLVSVLPIDRFFAACLIELDAEGTGLTVWNGGMPDLVVFDGDNAEVARVPSRNLPLGVLDNAHLEFSTERVAVGTDYRLLAYSDGLVEAHGADGELFGPERVDAVVAAAPAGANLVERLLTALDEHLGERALHDDVSILEIVCDPQPTATGTEEGDPCRVEKRAMHWSMETTLSADAIRDGDPVPTLVQYLTEIQGLSAHRQPLFTIIAELYSNAVEHGLLRLDSALKQAPDGFMRYYELREARLAALEAAEIRIAFAHEALAEDQGELTLTLSHDGAGFDAARLLERAGAPGSDRFSGRGIPLVRALCTSLEYSDDGRTAIARYRWPNDDCA